MSKKVMPGSKELEKEFLKQLKTIAKNEQHTKRKKISGSKPGKTKTNANSGRGNRSKKNSSSISKRNKLVSKDIKSVSKQPKTVKSNQGDRGVRQGNKKTRLTGTVITSRKRGKEEIIISFKGVRSINKKVDLVNEKNIVNNSIGKQLKRRGGKPPKGIIIIVRDKNGNEAAHVSIPSFVVNQNNVKKELEKFTNDLKEEYSNRQQDLADGNEVSELSGYEDYNPDNIISITIKFIY